MKILSIETSCDETAVSIVEANGGLTKPHFDVLGNSLFSQIDIHKEYGGVFPMLAKREHAKNLTLLLVNSLTEAKFYKKNNTLHTEEVWQEIKKILGREEGLYESLKKNLEEIDRPEIDIVSVTSGPGLEPALWVGISFAEAIGKLWNIPVIGVNHMEGHMASVLMDKTDEAPKENVLFPALALLISGGHTELVEVRDWGQYKILGQTRDDAVGEAFDKVARMLNLPYPGGPQISKLAEIAREKNIPRKANLPRPMIHSDNSDFSFSGLKTSVLYYIRDNKKLFDDALASQATNTNDSRYDFILDLAREFEDAVVDVLIEKTKNILNQTDTKTLIIAGGVIANKKIRQSFKQLEEEYRGLSVKTPTQNLATDNALMIACATYLNITLYPDLLRSNTKIIANGNLKLG